MSMELDALRKKHEDDLATLAQGDKTAEVFQARQAELSKSLEESQTQQAALQTELDGLKQRETDLLASLKQTSESGIPSVQLTHPSLGNTAWVRLHRQVIIPVKHPDQSAVPLLSEL